MKVLFVEYCAKDILDGTIQMEPMTELVYRRLIDMIYSTNDTLLDNDTLQYSTKAGKKWAKIRQELIQVHKKIFIENGYIRNVKCTEKLQKSRKNIEQKSLAGKLSSNIRNSLKEKETTPTAVETTVITAEPTNQKPNNQINKKKNNKKEKGNFEEFWQRCPKKVGKGDAEKKYNIALEEISHETLMKAIKAHAAEMKEREKKYIPNPATWLHQKRYFDEVSVQIEMPEDWPKWKIALAARIGDHNVKSYFHGAEMNGSSIKVTKRFQADKIKNEFIEDIKSLFGNYTIEVGT